MDKELSERRLAENQVVFRQRNEKTAKKLEKLKKTAQSEGHDRLARQIDPNIPLSFYCECSDENCREKIVLRPSDYKELRKNSHQFVLKPGHEVPSIERTALQRDDFIVVEKFVTTPKTADKLNITDIDNA